MAAEKVGEIYYEVTLDTSKALEQQRELARQLGEMPSTLTQSAQAAKSYATATEVAAKAATEAAQAMQSEAKAALEAAKSAQEKAQAAIADAQATQAQAQAAKQSSAEQRAAASSTAEATKATQQATKATRDHAAATDGAAKSSGELKQATRQLPAQFTDIITSLQGGQDPLTVLIQQGGQLKDQFGGVGAAARAMGGYILGLINPLTVAAAAVATFVTGLVMGQKEAQNLNASLIMTGQQSGVTSDQLSTMAASMDDMAGVTQAKATEALLTFINAGIRGEESLGKFTAAAIQLEKAGGASVEETAKKFKELEREPFKAAVKLDEAINFLDQSTKQHIKTLEEQGRMTDAARVAQEAYADAIANRVPKITENLGLIERAWRGIVNTAKEAGDALLSIGRTDTNTSKLDELRKKLASFEQKYPNAPTDSVMGRAKERVKLEIQGLEQQMKAGADMAAQQATEASKKRARDKADADAAKYLTDQQKLQLQIAKELGTLREAGASDSELKAREAAIRADFAKRQPKSSGSGAQFDSAGYMSGLSQKAASEWDRVGIIEAEALRQHKELLTKGRLTQAEYEDGRSLIMQAGTLSRQKIQQDGLDKLVQDILTEERITDEAATRKLQKTEQAAKAEQAARQLIADAAGDPVEKIRLEEEAKLAAQQAAYDQQFISLELFEQAKAAIMAQYAKAREKSEQETLQNQVNSASNAFGSIADITRGFAGEQNGIYRAMFAVSKGFAIAESIIKIQQGIANAAALPFPANIPAMATVAASTASIVSTIQGTNFGGGRQYGGPVSADSLYRVNERGAPEMYTASNGTQYMLPTANGQVTAANKIEGGGSVQWNIVVNNTATGTMASASVDQQSRTVQIAVTEVAQQISNNSGPVWSAMRGSTNIRSAL